MEFYDGQIPFYKPTDLEQGGNTVYSNDHLSRKGFEAARQLPANSILVTCVGATIGKAGVIRVEGACNQQINAVLPNDSVQTDYLYKYFMSAFTQQNIKDSASATTLPILNKTNFERLPLPLPPIIEQHRIVAEVERWFGLIDQIEQGKAELQTAIKQTKAKVLDLAIHGQLVPQDPADEPAIELLRRINPDFAPCDNGHYTQLPSVWQEVPMSVLCKLADGNKECGTSRVNLDVKYLRGESDGKLVSSGRIVQKDSLLILVDGENSGEVFRTPTEGYQGSTFKQLVINHNMCADYLLYVITLHRKALRESKVGSAIPHLNKKLFKSIRVPLPPFNEQCRIVSAINVMYKWLDTISENL